MTESEITFDQLYDPNLSDEQFIDMYFRWQAYETERILGVSQVIEKAATSSDTSPTKFN
jgi:hypothetical protein